MTDASFLYVTIDAVDPERSAAFWGAVLGTEIDEWFDDGRFAFLKGREGLPVVCIQRVPEAKSGTKNRVHLDLGVPDLDAATRRIEGLGGRWVDGQTRELEPFTWRTMADPDGNEFDIALVAG
ncbi:MAG TPA: VOC family protein [Actinomycetota bacterium]|nr:VOC family protein [Actinomycetota bacterium]